MLLKVFLCFEIHFCTLYEPTGKLKDISLGVACNLTFLKIASVQSKIKFSCGKA